MSLSGALSAALSGLRVNQEHMRVISGNVSNAGVEGFTRKTAAQSTQVIGQSTNGGVRIGEVQREVDQFLVGQIREGATTLSFQETKQTFFQRVQDFFGTLQNDSNLSNKINKFRETIEALAIEPENSAAQANIVQEAQELARQFRDFTQKTQDLRAEADVQLKVEVDKLNENLREVRDLNAQIAQNKGSGRSSAELEDRRDVALKEISESIDISTFERSTGEVVVVMNQASARPLVDGFVEQFSFDAAGSLGSGESGGPVNFGDGTAISDTVGGRLGALLQLRDQDLPNFQADLDRLAAMLREQVNEAHNTGTLNNQPIPPQAGAANDLVGAHQIGASAHVGHIEGSFDIVEVDGAGNVTNTFTFDLDRIRDSLAAAGQPQPQNVSQLVTQLNNFATDSGVFDGATVDLDGDGNNDTGLGLGAGPFVLNSSGQLTIESPTGNDFVVRTNTARINSASINAPDNDVSGPGAGVPDRNVSHFFGLNNFFETPDEEKGFSQTNPDMITGNMVLPGGSNAAADTGSGVSAASTIRVRQDIVADPNRLSRMEARTATGEHALPSGEPTVAQRMAQVFDTVFEFRAPADLRSNIELRSQTGVTSPMASLDMAPPAGLGAMATNPSQIDFTQNGSVIDSISFDPTQTSLNDLAAQINALPNVNATVTQVGGQSFLDLRSANGQGIQATDVAGDVAGQLTLGDPNLNSDQSTGSVGGRTVTLANFAGDILQFQANETARLNDTAEATKGVQDTLQLRLDNESGVNIDQELADLTIFQQAFNANARVITTVNEMFDALDRMAR